MDYGSKMTAMIKANELLSVCGLMRRSPLGHIAMELAWYLNIPTCDYQFVVFGDDGTKHIIVEVVNGVAFSENWCVDGWIIPYAPSGSLRRLPNGTIEELTQGIGDENEALTGYGPGVRMITVGDLPPWTDESIYTFMMDFLAESDENQAVEANEDESSDFEISDESSSDFEMSDITP